VLEEIHQRAAYARIGNGIGLGSRLFTGDLVERLKGSSCARLPGSAHVGSYMSGIGPEGPTLRQVQR
jgi:hypothetical protein